MARKSARKIIYGIVAVLLIIMGKGLLGEDLLPFLQWWLLIFGIGIIFLPLSDVLFHSFVDKGYLFAKTIGIGITGYLMWFMSSTRVLRFQTLPCYIAVGLGLLFNLYVLYVRKRKNKGKGQSVELDPSTLGFARRDTLNIAIMEELLFFAVFLLFAYIRGFKPDAYGTEKFMDYGFMTSMMRSDYMPPQDFWFSGTSLNYYYVGQFFATFLTRLSSVGTGIGYNLMLMMTGAFAFVLPFSIGYNLIFHYIKDSGNKKKGVLPAAGGILAGTGVCIAGNMHFPVYRWLAPWLKKNILGEEGSFAYWFADSTRYIGYRPETNDKTIHEFPSYSFILGDLHAHVINILFVLTVLGVLLAWLYGRSEKKKESPGLLKELFQPSILILGFFIGLFHMTNYWDYPIYFVVSGAIILFSNLIVYNFKGKAFFVTACQGALIMLLGELFCLPFTLNFNQISAIPKFTVAQTPLHQMVILWGLPVVTVIGFLIKVISDFNDSGTFIKTKKESKGKKSERILDKDSECNNHINNENKQFLDTKIENISYEDKNKEKGKLDISNIDTNNKNTDGDDNREKTVNSFLYLLMRWMKASDLFIITIGLCAMGLILLPEIVYIKDIYDWDYKRANTMFKLTYQAFIMFGICLGYIFIRTIVFAKRWKHKVNASIGLILFFLTVCYSGNAVKSWYGNIIKPEAYKGLDATTFLEAGFPEDYLAIQWLNENISGSSVVLEAPGDSYTDYQRVSVFTGLPTVRGWHTHEWLWKSEVGGTDDIVLALLGVRTDDIQAIYTSESEVIVRQLIEKYKISYIYVGKLENDMYEIINHSLLKSIGTVVFETPSNEDNNTSTYIIKVDHGN